MLFYLFIYLLYEYQIECILLYVFPSSSKYNIRLLLLFIKAHQRKTINIYFIPSTVCLFFLPELAHLSNNDAT